MMAGQDHDSNSELEYFHYLSGIMQKTRGARFAGSQLLVMKERASLLILALLSIFLIGLSVLLIADPSIVDVDRVRSIGVVSVVASISILTLTIFDYALARGIVAEKLHENALLITEKMRELERELAKAAPNLDTLHKCADDYEKLNISTNVNHGTMDYSVYLSGRRTSDCVLLNLWFFFYKNLLRVVLVGYSVLPGIITLCGLALSTYWLLQ
jgi:hypothetical protein